MPRLRKPQPVMLTDDELYAVMRATFQPPKVLKLPKWEPTGYELKLLKDAYKTITAEYYARAEEQERIDNELQLIRAEYEERENA
jgi:hypothetical protein